MSKKPDWNLPARKEDGRMPKPAQHIVDEMGAYESERLGRAICGAWLPVKGGVCCRKPKKNRNRCRTCGGNSPRGKDSPHYKHGLYSKELPGDLDELYEQSLRNEELISVRDDIAITNALIITHFRAIKDGAGLGSWGRLVELRERGLTELKSGNTEAFTATVRTMFEIIDDVDDRLTTEKKIVSLQDHKRRLTDTERRVQQDAETQINVEVFRILIDGLKEILRNRIADRGLRTIIADDIDSKILGRGTERAKA